MPWAPGPSATNGNDTFYGGDGDDNDLLEGGNHNDTLNGGNGAGTLYGRQNDDSLNGNDGNDALYGGDGIYALNGGGVDVLSGGNGDDVFTLAAGEANGDTLQEFVGNRVAAVDAIVFSGYGLASTAQRSYRSTPPTGRSTAPTIPCTTSSPTRHRGDGWPVAVFHAVRKCAPANGGTT